MGFPYVLRMEELNGAATAWLRMPDPVAAAFRTNLLGEALETPAASPGSGQWGELMLELRPHEIATSYLDLVPGRQVARKLDAYRSVWASAHRVESGHDLPNRHEA